MGRDCRRSARRKVVFVVINDWRYTSRYEREDGSYTPDVVDGALTFYVDGLSCAGCAGVYRINATHAFLTDFVPGDVSVVEFDYWVSDCMRWQDCNPGGETYRTIPRSFKVQDYHGNETAGGTSQKLMHWGTADAKRDFPNADYYPEVSCSFQENNPIAGVGQTIRGYHACYHYDPWDEQVTPPVSEEARNLDKQPGGDTYCPYYMPDQWTPRGHLRQADTCATIVAEKWQRIKMKITHGPWQNPRDNRADEPLTRVEIWQTVEGEPTVKVIDHMYHHNSPDPSRGGIGVGNIWLNAYMTGKWAGEDHPDGVVKYDNLAICSGDCPPLDEMQALVR